MKLWIDGQCFQTASNVRGIGRYVADFLLALGRHEDLELIISLNGRLRREGVDARQFLEGLLPEARIEVWYGITPAGEFHRGYCTERMTDERILAQHINDIAPDIALSPSPFEGSVDCSVPFITPDLVDAVTACIYHDAIPYRYPDVYLREENAEKLYMRRFERIGDFDLVLCNSDFTEAEYRDIYGRQNSAAISAGLSETFMELVERWQPATGSIGATLGKYALYVGGMDWRKNVPFLVRGLKRVPDVQRGEVKLVLAGDNGEEFIAPIRKMWADAGLPPEGLVSTGWISDADLVDLYKHAVVTLQPSLMEGFGLTALESWACGTPFLSAPGGAVAEVVGSDDYLFDPIVPPAFADLIGRTLHDDEFRDRMIRHGSERLGLFTWDRTAGIANLALRDALKTAGRKPSPKSERRVVEPAQQRLVMDVSSTAQSPVLSGIQRVMYKLSDAMLTLNEAGQAQTVLTYCRDREGWYALDKLDKTAVDLSPSNRVPMAQDDTYLLLDSSWTFIDGQGPRLLDAMLMGQEVVNGIHDIGPLTMSAMTDAGMPPAFRRWFEFILEHSTGIVCVSRAVADEVYDVLEGIEFQRPMKLGYFPLGADFADVPADPTGMDVFQERPSFLSVGTIEPRKGQLVILRAFEKLWADGHDINLVIIGKPGWDTEMIVQLLESHYEAGHRLHWIRNASDGNLRYAYEHCEALIMASFLEGFGLPVVEAGRFGTPVILSDLPVFREVGEGAPWASYFERSNPSDLADRVAEFQAAPPIRRDSESPSWPNWAQSAERLKAALFEDQWYKRYEPPVRIPNPSSSAVSQNHMETALSAADDKAHRMRIIEGPFLSDKGNQLRIVVALRNDSPHIWSSHGTPDGGYGINLGYHLYHQDGTCISFDNPRTEIPFVLLPGQETFLPIRIPIECFLQGATEIGIELVQEGVTWFNQEIRVGLLQPIDAAEALVGVTDPMPLEEPEHDLMFRVCRIPSPQDPNPEKYFYLSVLNRSSSTISLSWENGRSALSVGCIKDGQFFSDGTWVVHSPDAVAPNNFGYICLFVSADYLKTNNTISIRRETETCSEYWDMIVTEEECTFRSVELFETNAPVTQPPTKEKAVTSAETQSEETLHVEPAAPTLIGLTTANAHNITLRGFRDIEKTHTWMGAGGAEIQLNPNRGQLIEATQIVVFCKAYPDMEGPISLSISIGGQLSDQKYISHAEFMYYSFPISREMALHLRESKRISLVADKSYKSPNDQRDLSIAIASVELVAT